MIASTPLTELRFMLQLPQTGVVIDMPEIRAAFLAFPQMRRLQDALRPVPFFVVGGAVCDILRKPTELPKNIQCQVLLPRKEDILRLMQKHYKEAEIKVKALAVSVGNPTDGLDGIDLLVAHSNFDPAAVENGVNSLMFDLKEGALIDPFGASRSQKWNVQVGVQITSGRPRAAVFLFRLQEWPRAAVEPRV